MKNNIEELNWCDGIDNYKHHKLLINNGKLVSYELEILDKPIPKIERNISEIFVDIFNQKQTKFVEVLYSGGLDSELILFLCHTNKIPVKAITMRILFKGYPLNTHDLYYSEKFCRLNNIEQKFVDLNIEKIFYDGLYLKYAEPYKMSTLHVCTHMWLLEQCTGFPVYSGSYTWPWKDKKIISPHRYQFNIIDKFLKDNNIQGIGSMFNHSLELNVKFLKAHLDTYNTTNFKTDSLEFPNFKQKMFEILTGHAFELRMKSYGWEAAPEEIMESNKYKKVLVDRFSVPTHTIRWNNTIAAILGTEPGSNNLRY